MSFEIPDGLTDLLQDFTVAVLRKKPEDLVKFASNYFDKLKELKAKEDAASQPPDKAGSKGVRFDEPQDPDESDDELIDEPPPARFVRRKSVSAERYDPSADDELSDDQVIYPKSDEQRKRLSEAVKPIFLFKSLEPDQMHHVLDAMFERKVTVGEHVIDQHDDGDNFYVIDSGQFEIHVHGKHVGEYDNSGSFGELALMYNMPRAATIIATSEGILWAMDRATFRRIVLKNTYEKRKMYENLLEGVPMLKRLEEYERMNIADALFSRTYEDHDVIIRQGDSADCMYFVEDGEVKITVKNMVHFLNAEKVNDGRASLEDIFVPNEPDSEEKEVSNKYTKGSYFGELALVTHKPRAATCYAVGKTRLAVLDVKAFERLLGPCMDIMKRNIDEYEEQLVNVFGSKADIGDLR